MPVEDHRNGQYASHLVGVGATHRCLTQLRGIPVAPRNLNRSHVAPLRIEIRMDSRPEDFGNLPGVKSRGRWYNAVAAAPLQEPDTLELPAVTAIPSVPPIAASILCMKPRGQLTQQQAEKVDRLKASLPNFAIMRRLAMRFRGILRGHDPTKLDGWLKDARETGLYGIKRFVSILQRDIDAVRNAVSETWSNGQTEGQINRLKTLKRSMYGRAGIELLRARMLPFRS
jgi:hypothetical protein